MERTTKRDYNNCYTDTREGVDMQLSQEILQKYAATNKVTTTGVGKFDEKTTYERELIRRAQGGDFMAFKELQILYHNVIVKAVTDSGLGTVMDNATALSEANKAFKDLVMKNFDLTKPNKPSTYFIGQLANVLRGVKYNHRDFVARKSEELSMHSEVVATARNFLKKELMREPSSQEIYGFVKNNLRTGKSLTVDKINRINALNRTEYSGDIQIGGDTDKGADYITFEDVMNTSKKTPEEIMTISSENDKIERMIEQMPKRERRMLKNYYGLGEFKGQKNTSLNRVSVNNGMTYYEAQKALQNFRNLLMKEGIFE